MKIYYSFFLILILTSCGSNNIEDQIDEIIRTSEKEEINESTITQKLEINAFFPIQSIAPGVARMRVENKKGLCLTVKPGSYVWPKSIWKFN